MSVGTPPSDAIRSTPSEVVDFQLDKATSLIRWVDVAGTLVKISVSTLAILLGVVLLDHWVLDIGRWGRFAALLLVLSCIVVHVYKSLIPLVMHRINPLYAAQVIEQANPNLKNSLINLLFFRTASLPASPMFVSMEAQAADDLSATRVETAIDRTSVIHMGYVLVALLALGGLYIVMSPKDSMQSLARIATPWRAIERPALVRILNVAPGNAEVFHGETLSVTGAIVAKLDRNELPVELIYRSIDGRTAERRVPMAREPNSNRYACELNPGNVGITQPLAYRIQAGEVASSEYRVDVSPAPVIRVEQVRYDLPEYTGLASEVSDHPDIQGLEGTRVTLRARANYNLQMAQVEFDPVDRQSLAISPTAKQANTSRRLSMNVKGNSATVSFRLRMSADRDQPWHSRYQLLLVTGQGAKNRSPIQHTIQVRPDLMPVVEILQPSRREMEVPENGSLTIEVRAVDPDFGLQRLELKGIVGSKKVFQQSWLDETATGQVVKKYLFIPRELGLSQGNTVLYWAEAEDNRTSPMRNEPAPNLAKTPNFTIRIVAEQPSQDSNRERGSEPDRADSPTEERGDGNTDQRQPDSSENQTPSNEPGNASPSESSGRQPSPQDGNSASQEQTQDVPGDGSQGPKPQGRESADGSRGESKGNQGKEPPNGGTREGADRQDGASQGEPSEAPTENATKPEDQQPLPNDGSQPGDVFDRVLQHMQEQGENRPSSEDASASTVDGEGQRAGQPDDGTRSGESPSDNRGAKSQRGNEEEPTDNRAPTGEGQQTKRSDDASDQSAQGVTPDESDRQSESGGDPRSKPSESANGNRAEEGSSERNGVQPEPATRQDDSTSSSERSEQGRSEQGRSEQEESGSDRSTPQDGSATASSGRPPDRDGEASNESPEQGKPAVDDTATRDDNGQTGDNAEGDSSDAGASPHSETNRDERRGADSNGEPSEGNRADSVNRPNDQTGREASREQPDEGKRGPESKSETPDTEGTDRSPGNQGTSGKSNPGSANLDSTHDAGQRGDSTSQWIPSEDQEDEAILEYAREKTELALKYLEDQGDSPDRELLDRLGWTKEDVKKFVKRWSEMYGQAEQKGTAGIRAKRNLNDALRGLGLRPSQSQTRRVGSQEDAVRGIRESGTRNQPPSRFREQYEAFLRGINRSD